MAVDNNFNNLWYDNNLFPVEPDPLPRGRTSLEEDPTYYDAVSASWQLEPVGQFTSQIKNEDLWLNQPEEVIPDIDDQLIGYEDYFDHFLDVRNQTHLDFIKEKIEYNIHLRSVRESHGITPEIIAAFGDPITYLPIPLVKGVSFGRRFLQGAKYSASFTALAEPIRQELDPTATLSESALYITGAGILGGGIYGAFGKRGVGNVGKGSGDSPGDKANAMMENFYDSENVKLRSDYYNQDSDKFYKNKNKDYKLENNSGDDITIDEKNKINNESILELKKGETWRGNTLKHDTIVIDEAKLKQIFDDGTYVEPDVPGANRINEFDTFEDYVQFVIQKKIMKNDGTAPIGKNDIETENLINAEVYDDILANKIGRETAGRGSVEDRSWIAEKVDRAITTLGSLTNNKIKNKRISNAIADFALSLTGDGATVTRASKAGVAIGASALIKATQRHFRTIGNFNQRLQRGFQQYRKGINETNKETVGYNFGATGIRFGDAVDTGVRKLGFKKGQTEQVKFGEFTELITKAIRDKEYFESAHPVIQGLANEIKGIYRLIGEEAERLGMFQKQKDIKKLIQKYIPRIKRAELALKNAKDPEIKAIIKRRLDYAKNKLEELEALEDDIVEGLIDEFNPLVDDYVNRVYDIDAINKDISNEVWLPNESIEAIEYMKNLKDSSYKGIIEGMVVSFRKNQLFTDIQKGSQVETLKGEYGVVTKIKGKQVTVEITDKNGKVKTKKFGEGFLIHVKGQQVGKKDNIYGTIKTLKDNGDIIATIDGQDVTVGRTRYKVKSQRLQDYHLNDLRYVNIPQEGTFRRLLYDNFKEDPNAYTYKNEKGESITVEDLGGVNQTVYINAKVNDTIAKIRRDGQNLNMDGNTVDELGLDGKTYINNESAFQSRSIRLTDKELEGYLINDINYLLRMYSEKMHKRIAMAEKFGEASGETRLWDMDMDILENITKDELPEAKRIMTDLKDNRDKIYNIFNTTDPSSFMKSRLPASLRNWASTAMMGKVLFASIVDFARIPLVHGFANTFRYLNSKHLFAADKKEFNEQIAQNAWLGDVYDVQMNQANARHTGNTEYRVGRGESMFGQYFDKIVGKPLEGLQSPFYHMNLLSAWTHKMKEMTQHISTHRFLEDCQKVANGTASELDISRLAQYGINKKDARGIAKMPTYKTTNGMLYTKEQEWLSTPKGNHYADLLRFGSFMDVQRTIITPSIADKPNMMFGVIRIRNEGLADAFDNDVFRFLGGFEKTEFGGKFNNGFLALPFQFYAWSFAANRKLMLAGLSGREQNLMMGVISMIGFAAMGDYLKNPLYYQHKSSQERIYRAIEMSGVLGLPADVNFMLETISEGFFDTPLGIRPSIGTPGRFGDASYLDAAGEFTGAGPSLLMEAIQAIGGDMPIGERSMMLKRLLPFNNVLYLDGINKKIANSAAEFLK